MAELKRKVTIRRKEAPVEVKKSKWRLLLLLASVIIVVVILIVSNNSSNNTDKSLIAKTEQAIKKVNEVIADVQNGKVNYEDAKAKVAVAQKEVDEINANAKTNEEKQAFADAQAKVDDAAKAVEILKQATQPLETDKTVAPEKNGGVATTTPLETSTKNDATNQKPMASTTITQGSQSSTKKTSTNASSQSTVTDRTLEQKAKEVIRGNYGNGYDRKSALRSEYDAIQSKVNEMYRNGEVR